MPDKTDIIERAETLLALPTSELGLEGISDLADLVPEFIDELKSARTQLEQRRINTVDELKQLKPRPDLLSGVLIKALGIPAFGGVFELNDDGTWNDYDSEDPSAERTPAEDVPLPAIVIWTPEVDADGADA